MSIGKAGIGFVVVIVLTLAHTKVWAQYDANRSIVDSTYVIPNKDSLEQKFMEKDTTESKFIESVEKTANKSGFTRWLSSSVFVREKNIAVIDSIVKEDYSEYNGKIIRSVKVTGLSPYEPSDVFPDDNTQGWLSRAADATHATTQNFILRNNLMVKNGDVFNNEMIINNLAYYRGLRYIYDARVVIKPAEESDYVDVEFVVKDVWSIGFNLSRLDLSKINFELYDRNVIGLGAELKTGVFYERSDGKSYLGYTISQSEENLSGTFFSSRAEILDRKDKKLRHVSLNRNVLPHLRTVGGASYQYLDENHYFITIDTTHRVINETADAWFGKVFNLSSGKSGAKNRLATMVRYEYRKLRNRMPSPTERHYDIYEDRNLYIASLSLYRQQYYTDRLLYGFGINENIPYGYNVTLQAGYEDHYYGQRFYSSLSFKYGKQFSWGYASVDAAIAGYLVDGNISNGLMSTDLLYFSPLIPLKNQAFRQFLYISYVRGVNRGVGEASHLDYTDDLLFDLSGNKRQYFGNSKLTVSLETDFFSTVKLLGFRFVFFNFLDMTWIGNKTDMFSNDLLPGIGFGVRIRNDKLVFKTLQLKLGWYPKFPQSGFSEFFDVNTVDRFRENDFAPQKPQTIEFK